MKSHQQRKHSGIEEKHELSDDNEKGTADADKMPEAENKTSQQMAQNLERPVISEHEAAQSNNNNENESSTNCDACSQRKRINSANVAIQCDVEIVENSTIQTKIKEANDGKY